MTGIVVVSHSRALATAAVALATEMVPGDPVRVAVAAGLDETTFGTDATAILAAVQEVDDGAGVVVLMDLGSAVLSAELALDLLEPEQRERVVLSPAPLVEGLVVAVVTASGGAGPAAVAAEAGAALGAKRAQLGADADTDTDLDTDLDTDIDTDTDTDTDDSNGTDTHSRQTADRDDSNSTDTDPGPTADNNTDADAVPAADTDTDTGTDLDPDPDPRDRATGTFEVVNPHGLHARPAAALVRAARHGDTAVELRNVTTGSGWVPAGSLSRVATLGALRGHTVAVRAHGPDAERAVRQLLDLAADRFGEPTEAQPARQDRHLSGTEHAEPDPRRARRDGPYPAAPGVAFGPAVLAGAGTLDLAAVDAAEAAAETAGLQVGGQAGKTATEQTGKTATEQTGEAASGPAGGPADARARSAAAARAVRADLAATREATDRAVGAAEAAIFDAQLLLLDDANLLADVDRRIAAGAGPARAWLLAADRLAAEFAALPDPYLAARAADVRAVADAVARALLGTAAPEPSTSRPGILVADDLTPAQVAALDPTRVLGIVLAAGSPTGHAAILARARGIPTVVSAGPGVLALTPGTPLGLDGSTGELRIDPTAAERADLERRRSAAAERAGAALAAAAAPAVTGDGVRVLVGANLGSRADAERAARDGADLAGLVRTEFLFLDRPDAPDVDEQVAAYRGLAAALGGRRITLRTLDVGGDKPLLYAPQPAEANPFLGVRGIRFALAQQRLLTEQLLAIVRVAHETPVSVMFPMVSTLDELRDARHLLDAAVAAVGRGTPSGLLVGIMVEVPATALRAAAFAPLVDFLSIGTNDLTQYALAAERGNPALAALADPLDPAVLALVAAVCRAAGTADGPLVAVCGELAADEAAVALLIALGVRELSVAPPAVPAIKAAVRRAGSATDPELVARALGAPDPAAVRRLLGAATPRGGGGARPG